MNKKVITQFAAAVMLTGVVACSSTSETTKIVPVALEQDYNLCYYGNSEMRAPDWVCGTPVEGYPVSAVGSFRETKAGTNFARNQATMDGRVQLATEMKAKVGAMVKNHAETTGVGDQETVDSVASVTQRQITAEMLYGAKPLNYRKGPDGTTYALLVLDPKQAASAAKQAMVTSYKNKRAEWQRFLGDKAQKELEAEMDKMIGNEFGTAPIRLRTR